MEISVRAASENDGGPMIRVHKLEKSFAAGPRRTFVLRQIDLAIGQGEFVSIMGPSGAGKSTLLHVLGLHDPDFAGEYFFRGAPVQAMKPRSRMDLQRRNIGFVFQKYHLLDDLTVGENLELPLSYRDVPRPERQARVADVLDRFRIVAKRDLYPAQLSGGQQQIVGVARAVIADPALILADEPTGNLHSDQGREIMELFGKLNASGTTIVQVTHSEANAAFGGRIVRLCDGWIEDGARLDPAAGLRSA